jgi:hypothetical protein
MNERIKELFEQASKEFSAEHKYATFIVPTPLKEKFAELIVRECISALDEKIYRSIDGDGDEIWADLILKEHFGVEE